MSELHLTLTCENDPSLDRALSALSEIAKRVPQAVDAFLGLFQSSGELVRVDGERFPAASAGDLRVVLQPSDRLLGFVAAFGTRDRDDL